MVSLMPPGGKPPSGMGATKGLGAAPKRLRANPLSPVPLRRVADLSEDASEVLASKLTSKIETLTIYELQSFVRQATRHVMTQGSARQREQMKELVQSLNLAKKSGLCRNPTREMFSRVISMLSPKQLKVIWANSLSPMATQTTEANRTPSPELELKRQEFEAVEKEDRAEYVRTQAATANRRRIPRILRELLSALTRQCDKEQRALAEGALHDIREAKSRGRVGQVTSELYHTFERILRPEQVDVAWRETQDAVQEAVLRAASTATTTMRENKRPVEEIITADDEIQAAAELLRFQERPTVSKRARFD